MSPSILLRPGSKMGPRPQGRQPLHSRSTLTSNAPHRRSTVRARPSPPPGPHEEPKVASPLRIDDLTRAPVAKTGAEHPAEAGRGRKRLTFHGRISDMSAEHLTAPGLAPHYSPICAAGTSPRPSRGSATTRDTRTRPIVQLALNMGLFSFLIRPPSQWLGLRRRRPDGSPPNARQPWSTCTSSALASKCPTSGFA